MSRGKKVKRPNQRETKEESIEIDTVAQLFDTLDISTQKCNNSLINQQT